MQLIHHHAFCTIDDELTTTKHHGNIAEIHFLFVRLFAIEAQIDLQWLTKRQTKLSAFFG
jgi:hypothetical protein